MIAMTCDNCRRAIERPRRQENLRAYCSKPCRKEHCRLLANERVERRFWSKVDRRGPDDCWPWTGGLSRAGYGVFVVKGQSGSMAHRFSYGLNVGPVPEGLHVLHRCDNPPCVNPAHLRPGTDKDNARDMMERGRRTNFTTAVGCDQHQAKLTDDRVREILASAEPTATLAVRFGVRYQTVYSVRKGRSWKHIPRVSA